jgi:hypothetical protein
LAKRSRRQPSILVFLAQDADAQVFCYANADIRKGEEADEIFRFIDFWKRQHGKAPQHLVFDSKLTTYAGLDRLDAAGITFLTLRRRSPKLLAEAANLPASAWRTVELDIPHRKYSTPRFYEQKARPLGRAYRQFFITDLGHDEPTILLTNDTRSTVKQLITRYAKRMLIENALADAVRFFHIDALSSSVGFKVDFDMALLVLASGSIASWPAACAAMTMPRPARSSAISSTCRPTSPLPRTKSGCGSIAAPIFPSFSHRGCSINPSKFPGGTADPSGSSNRPANSQC